MLLEAGLTRRSGTTARSSRGSGRGCSSRSTTCAAGSSGFGGRLLGPGEPKYLNSPETPIFHKGKQLYNLHQAKSAIRKEESVILVEGYFDVLRLVLAGIENVVAPLGTSLTRGPGQPAPPLRAVGHPALRQRPRRTPRHLPGRRRAAAPRGPGPGGHDAGRAKIPTPWCGRAARRRSSRSSTTAMDVLERKIQLLERKGWFEGVEHQREALDRLLPTIRAAADPITRDLYLKTVAERTGVSREVLREQARGAPAPAAGESAPPADTRVRRRRPRCRPARPAAGRRSCGGA